MLIDITNENEWEKMNRLILFNMMANGKWVVMYNEMRKLKTRHKII